MAWQGFLGATDPEFRRIVAECAALVDSGATDMEAHVGRLIAPRNVAGLADPARARMYPVDLDTLVAQSDLLGLDRDTLRAALPRLRGGGA